MNKHSSQFDVRGRITALEFLSLSDDDDSDNDQVPAKPLNSCTLVWEVRLHSITHSLS